MLSCSTSVPSASATRSQRSSRVSSDIRASSISPIARKAQRAASDQRRREQQRLEKQQGGRDASSSSIPPMLRSLAQSTPVDSESYNILEAFFYGRALAITISKRLSEVLVEGIAEVSKIAAERPQRVKDFQDEVALLARKEMAEASVPERSPSFLPSSSASTSSSSTPGSGGGGSSSGTSGAGSQDLQAIVDELRSEIAYSRALLQQMRAQSMQGSGGVASGTLVSSSSNGNGLSSRSSPSP